MISGEQSERVGVDRLYQVEGERSCEIRRFAHQVVHSTYGHVILKIAAHSSRIADHGDVQLSQMLLRPDPRHHQQLRRLYRACRHYHLPICPHDSTRVPYSKLNAVRPLLPSIWKKNRTPFPFFFSFPFPSSQFQNKSTEMNVIVNNVTMYLLPLSLVSGSETS